MAEELALSTPLDPAERFGLESMAIGWHATALAAAAAPVVDLATMRLVSEREPGPWICCGPCSYAMVAAFAGVAPATLEAAHAIRAAAGYAHTGGTSPGPLRRGLADLYGLELEPLRGLEAIDELLADGGAAACFVHAAMLPASLRRWAPAFAGDHVVALVGRSSDGLWGWWNPLAPAGSPGLYAQPADVTRAAWPTGTYGTRGARAMEINAARLTTAQTVRVADGAVLYDDPELAHRRTAIADGPTDVGYVGLSGAAAAVYVSTAAGEADGISRPRILFLPRAEAGPPVDRPAPAPATGGDVEAAARQAAGDMWDRWALGLGIPSRPAS